ncbi:MAG: hypothetical protein IKS31_01950 [Clostridia bacterium]|nr:hypothetical protein [Clostridia bacterium]MBR4457701.1 hypothetical protein [Clostridia bacterium]
MRKWILMMLALALVATAAIGLAGAEQTNSALTCGVEDGCYVIRVRLNDGDDLWLADAPGGDGSVMTLSSAGNEDGYFVARYAPAADGDTTVSLRHMKRGVCDILHTFDLHVEGGEISSTGGSYTASPADDDLTPYLRSEWLEKETQFTVMTLRENLPEGGWDAEITSPMTRGAFVLRAHVGFDCAENALLYFDGALYPLTEDGEPADEAEKTGLSGSIVIGGTEEAVELTWTDAQVLGNGFTVFEKGPALPAWTYSGSDPVEAALTAYMTEQGWADDFGTCPGSVCIPAPVVIGTEETDEAHLKVYANLWLFNYQKMGRVLDCISGGECACLAILEKDGEGWKVAEMTLADAGDDYWNDIETFTNGDGALTSAYAASSDLFRDPAHAVRIRFIREYVEANDLLIDAFRDYGWPDEPLAE